MVKEICERVKSEGDQALKAYNKELDKVDTPQLAIPFSELEAAFHRLDNNLREALQHSHARIETYQKSIKWTDQQGSTECYEMYHPLERVGVIPGGKASYPSTVLMTATLIVAGVENITVVTPPQAGGLPDIVLAACYTFRLIMFFKLVAHKVAALAYGTETIPKVDKIVGPGNQYVACEKIPLWTNGYRPNCRPSEIALIIDKTAD